MTMHCQSRRRYQPQELGLSLVKDTTTHQKLVPGQIFILSFCSCWVLWGLHIFESSELPKVQHFEAARHSQSSCQR